MANQQRIARKNKSLKKTIDNNDHNIEYTANDSEKILKYTDELLDEIDELVNVVGVSFVKEFVQRGGQ